MLKRTVILIGLLSMSLIVSVSSFSKAYVHSQAKLKIVAPQDALVSVYEEDGAIRIENNKSQTIMVCPDSITCLNGAIPGHYQIGMFDSDISPGQAERVQITFDDGLSADMYGQSVPFRLEAQWEGGKAVIDFDVTIPMQIAPPAAPIIDDQFQAPVAVEVSADPSAASTEEPQASTSAPTEESQPPTTQPTEEAPTPTPDPTEHPAPTPSESTAS